jgi:hypothetical protein
MNCSRITRLLRVVGVTLVLAVPAVAPQVASAGWTWDDGPGWTWDESAPVGDDATAPPERPAQPSP